MYYLKGRNILIGFTMVIGSYCLWNNEFQVILLLMRNLSTLRPLVVGAFEILVTRCFLCVL